jgi:hypothetical protein
MFQVREPAGRVGGRLVTDGVHDKAPLSGRYPSWLVAGRTWVVDPLTFRCSHTWGRF